MRPRCRALDKDSAHRQGRCAKKVATILPDLRHVVFVIPGHAQIRLMNQRRRIKRHPCGATGLLSHARACQRAKLFIYQPQKLVGGLRVATIN